MRLFHISKHHHAVAFLLASVLLWIVCLMSASCSPRDLSYREAIEIAKKDFGCDKILWIQTNALVLETKPDEIPSLRSHYSYYIVGEKNGKEIDIVVPSNPDLEEAYISTWGLDHSFTQIVEKFNDFGAHYIADVPDDYDPAGRDRPIELFADRDTITHLAEYYNADGELLYDRLDLKAIFEYRWEADGVAHRCMVFQEGGELKAYESAAQ